MLGVPLNRFGSFTVDAQPLLSIQLDWSFNVQYQLPIHYRGVGVSVGVQDIVSNEDKDRSSGFGPVRLGSQLVLLPR